MYEFLYHLKLTAANSRGLSNNHHTLGNSKGTIPVDGTGYPDCYAFFGSNGKVVVFPKVQYGQWYTPSNYLFVARNNNNGRNFFAFYQYFEQRKR